MRTLRTRLATAVVAAVMVGAMAGTAPASSDSPGVIPSGQEGKIPPGEWTQDQIDTLLEMIDDAETVLPATYPMSATYEELSTTLGAMGYHDFGIEAPGGYAHWINNDLLDDDTLDPARVESLVYQFDYTDYTYRLVSAMYMLGADRDTTSIPADLAWLPGWHAHEDLCVTPGLVFHGFAPCSAPAVSLSQYPMMHVWIVDNACDHRFGGVDQGGLHCEVMHHEPGEHEPGEHEPSDHEPEEHGPEAHGEHEPEGHEMGEVDESSAPNGAVPVAGPAPAVAATANFTG